MSLVILYCPDDKEHSPIIHYVNGSVQLPKHPEDPRRSACLFNAVKSTGEAKIVPCSREASVEELTVIHNPELVHFVNNAWESLHKFDNQAGEIIMDITPYFLTRNEQTKPKTLHLQTGFFCFDASTPIGKNTAKIARISAAIAIDAAKLMKEKIQSGEKGSLIYALCRPPGHHATKNFYGGYCYFNNAALAAEVLSKSGRVVVFDVDYHHGNGTQDIFYDRNDVYYISIHGDPDTEYPFFAGYSKELGVGDGLNHNRNFPLPIGTTWKEYKPVYEEAVNIIRSFQPTTIVISLGLDTADGDPICQFHLLPPNYHEMGNTLRQLNIPILVIQEGGYSPDETLGASAAAFIKGLRGAE